MEFNVLEFIQENMIVVVPVLWFIGYAIKSTEMIKDKFIPIILGGFGVIIALGLLGINMNAVIQGILVASATVYGNELVKQARKSE